MPGVVYVPGSPDFLVLYVDFSSEDVKVEKKPFVTREQLEEIKKTYPTPFHLYDEKGIRENGERLMRAFSWNKGFREYFAVKATPNPFVIDILKKLGCGVDCSSLTELMMAKAMKYDGEKIMFSSNDTPPEEFKMAAELGADVYAAKRAGLLHDIGKAVDHEVEGPHALIGADLAKKYNESKEILHAIAAHHEDQRPETALAVLVQAADSLSGARPGARKELLESYVKRLEDLENIASEFDGVSKAYAIQAGREIRVMVNSENVDDDQTYMLCKGITGKIEENLTYPGQIRVTVIRERRAVGYAK